MVSACMRLRPAVSWLLAAAVCAVLAPPLLSTAHVHHECVHDTPELQRSIYGVHRPNEAVDSAGGEFVMVLGTAKPRSYGASSLTPEGPEEMLTALVKPQAYAGDASDRSFRVAAAAPLRVVFRTLDLDDPAKYCTSAGGTSPNFQGSYVSCSEETVFNSTHRALLRDVVLPRAAEILSRFLSVVPVAGRLLVSSNSGLCGGQYTIPADDKTNGVADADIVFYVSAGPIGGSTIAWAGYCQLDQNGRPIVARTNFSPKYLNAKTPREIDYLVRVGVHELIHALGFSSTYINSANFKFPSAIKSGTTRRGGQPVTLYTGPSALRATQAHFSCDPLDGVELEDEGGSGTAGSHWERRTHKEDVMAGIAGDVMTLSAMTFGLLEDSGHYTVNFAATEPETYMRGIGCGVFESRCDTEQGGAGSYFCFDETGQSGCTADFSAFGPCSAGACPSNLPTWAEYNPRLCDAYSLMDYCPTRTGYSNRQCNRYDNASPNNTAIGLYFGSDGRCFKTTGTLYKGFVGPDNGPARCLRARCPGGVRIEFQVGDSAAWVQCPTDGSPGDVNAPSPYTGKITCPYASDFCTEDLLFGVAEPTTTLAIGETLPPRPTTTRSRASGGAVGRTPSVSEKVVLILSLFLFHMFASLS